MEQLIQKIEELGWSVNKEGDHEYLLGKFSPAGQDFSISVEGEDAEELVDSIREAYENFDVSYETYLWLDHTGHGKNGAPYHMKDLLEDMETCEAMIQELHNQLTTENV
ncbi:hypothetical protein IMZ31_20100 (plasmid) [Pontibacillus sp. ALD_SL1]|nr:hypothetical protein IMZ31_20100 [Pontibacillus sp. ALD_SL1]